MNAPWWRLPAKQYTSNSPKTENTRTLPDDVDTDLLPPFFD
jgi:hypothetical protein